MARFTVPSLNLTNYFELIVNSYNEKRGKDDENGRNFTEVIEKYHSSIENSILIDNSEKSCRLFESLGGKSYLVTKDQSLAHWLNTQVV
jgi:FMN phosphatase YigB (HAD superfamily)